MGRLSSYAKNRILKLRFKKNKRIIHIVDILKKDDNIKVSRQAVSTFLKKYLETNSIYDKPRTGRKRKLTQEEIQLIGQVTRLNRDITARAIKEYLNLNVSTYTILRATKLFEWNKVNPNSNEQKKAAALERQLNGETSGNTVANGKRRRSNSTGSHKKSKRNQSTTSIATSTTENEDLNESSGIIKINDDQLNQTVDEDNNDKEKETINNKNNNTSIKSDIQNETNENLNESENKESSENIDTSSTADITEIERIQEKLLNCNNNNNTDSKGDLSNTAITVISTVKKSHKNANSIPDFEKVDLNLIPHKELAILKNLSCSPMSFATKILFKIFKIEELHGHNVSGKTLNKNLKAKLPLDPIRIGYIKFLVEKYYDEKECKEMLSGANTHKQDLWKSCHTAINKSILISERKAACGKPPLPSSDLAGDLNSSNLDDQKSSLEDENEYEDDEENKKSKTPKAGAKQAKKKSKYDFSSEDEKEGSSSSDSEIVIPKKYLMKKPNNHRLPNNNNNNKRNDGKRNKRFNSSSSESDFDESLASEDIDSGDEHSNSDDQENERKGLKKVTNLLKGKMKEEESIKNGNRRRSQRQRKPTYKNVDYTKDNLDTDDDEGVKYNDEDDQEIELIQNIESRLTSATNNNNNNNGTKLSSPPVVTSSSPSLKLPIIKSNPIQVNTKAKDDSEETAAANIAAAMKKRFVVVQPSSLIQNNETSFVSSSPQSQTTALKSPNLNPTSKTIKDQKSIPSFKKETPISTSRQQPRRGKPSSNSTTSTPKSGEVKTIEENKTDTKKNSNINNNNSIVQKSKKDLDESTKINQNNSITSNPNNNSNSERRTTRSSSRK